MTDRQARDITRIYENRVRELKPISEEVDRRRAELDKMARERTADVATFAIHVSGYEALRSELYKTRTVMFYAISRILSAEQNEKLRQIRDRRRSGRGGGGPR